MRKVIDRVSLIVSIFPADLGPERRPNFRGNTTGGDFRLAAYTDPEYKARPQILEITDMHEAVSYGSIVGSITTLWRADLIAADIARGFASGHLGSSPTAVPGVWVIDDPERDESGEWIIDPIVFAEYRQKQDKMFLNLVNLARKSHRDGRHENITALMREAARFLKIEGEEWQDQPTSAGRKFCPFCQSAISAKAAICPQCNQVVDQAEMNRIKALVNGASVPVVVNLPDAGETTILQDLGMDTPAVRQAAGDGIDTPALREITNKERRAVLKPVLEKAGV